MLRLSLVLFALFVSGSALAGDVAPNFAATAVEQDAAWTRDWWHKRHQQKIQEAKKQDIDLVFIGNSITHSWENDGAVVWRKFYWKRKALNLGFSGDRTEHVLWRLQNGALDDVSPSLVVLMIGTNNTGHRMDPAEYTADGIKSIVAELRSRVPDAQVLVLGVFPRHLSPHNDMRRRNQAINERIAGLSDDENVHYLDIGSSFMRADGTLRADLMPDLLHLNRAGYGVWAEAMEPTLQRLLGKD
ncbi:MAG: platelet-activating factor acetylhydrolase IB subunit [Pseudomonadota bacterium]